MTTNYVSEAWGMSNPDGALRATGVRHIYLIILICHNTYSLTYFLKKQHKIWKSVVMVPLQIILIFTISSSIYIKISHNSGISAGNSNQNRFRFQSGVPPIWLTRPHPSPLALACFRLPFKPEAEGHAIMQIQGFSKRQEYRQKPQAFLQIRYAQHPSWGSMSRFDSVHEKVCLSPLLLSSCQKRPSDLGVTFLTECRTIFGLHPSLDPSILAFWPFSFDISLSFIFMLQGLPSLFNRPNHGT